MASAKEKSWQGLKAAGSMAAQAKDSISKKGGEIYDKNYHGQLYDNMGQALNTAAVKAS